MASQAPLSLDDRLAWYNAGEHWDPQIPYPLLDNLLSFSVDLLANMRANPAYSGWVEFYSENIIPYCRFFGNPPQLYLPRDDLVDMIGDDRRSADKILYGITRRGIHQPTVTIDNKLHFKADFALAILMDRYITLAPLPKSDDSEVDEDDDEEVDLDDFARLKELAMEPPQRCSHQFRYANMEALPPVLVNGQEYLIFNDILELYITTKVRTGKQNRLKADLLYDLAEYCMDSFIDCQELPLPPPVQRALAYHTGEFDPARTLLDLRHYFLENSPPEPEASAFAARGPLVRPMNLVEVTDQTDVTEELLTEVSEQEKREIKAEEDEDKLSVDLERAVQHEVDPEIAALGNPLARVFLSAFRESQVLFCLQCFTPEAEASWWALRALSCVSGHSRIQGQQRSVILVMRSLALTALCQDTPGSLGMKMVIAAPLATFCPPEFTTEAALAAYPSAALLRYRPRPAAPSDDAGPSS